MCEFQVVASIRKWPSLDDVQRNISELNRLHLAGNTLSASHSTPHLIAGSYKAKAGGRASAASDWESEGRRAAGKSKETRFLKHLRDLASSWENSFSCLLHISHHHLLAL